MRLVQSVRALRLVVCMRLSASRERDGRVDVVGGGGAACMRVFGNIPFSKFDEMLGTVYIMYTLHTRYDVVKLVASFTHHMSACVYGVCPEACAHRAVFVPAGCCVNERDVGQTLVVLSSNSL